MLKLKDNNANIEFKLLKTGSIPIVLKLKTSKNYRSTSKENRDLFKILEKYLIFSIYENTHTSLPLV